jgi:hypothetical protein
MWHSASHAVAGDEVTQSRFAERPAARADHAESLRLLICASAELLQPACLPLPCPPAAAAPLLVPSPSRNGVVAYAYILQYSALYNASNNIINP